MTDKFDEIAYMLSWLVPLGIVFIVLVIKIIKDLLE
jgi:hypothetical protein